LQGISLVHGYQSVSQSVRKRERGGEREDREREERERKERERKREGGREKE